MNRFTTGSCKYRRRGFTTAELITVILAIAVISSASISAYGTALTRANVNQTAVSMEFISADLAEKIPQTSEFSLDDNDSVEDFLYELSEHSSLDFDTSTVEKKSDGFTVLTAKYNDGFNRPFKLYFSQNFGRVMCISGGKNTEFQNESDYSNGSFGDDIVMLIQFKDGD